MGTSSSSKNASISATSSNFDDYESLPTHRVYVHLMAGAAAGILEHTAMFPIDSVKTRMQSLCPCPERSCRTPVGGLFTMIKKEGVLRPIRGINVVASLAGPAHALYFTIYEKMKHHLTNGKPGFHHYAYGMSACAATLVHDAVMNPAEVVKQRLQMWGSPFRGCVECAKCLLKTEGLCAFYRSYTTQILMNIPYHTAHFMIYELVQEKLNPRRTYDPKSHMAAGALAGGFAAAITTPLDVCKTALNTQDFRMANIHCPSGLNLNGLTDACRAVYANRGLWGFWSGIQARVLFQMPATAISWSIYEFFKYALAFTEPR
uniref:Mitochondrial carrier protein n=1 Tax=Romanomermis culicivorax TaxID=13658 RepID=A0A915I0E6_ROMCU